MHILCCYYYAVNALTFETTAYYYTESKLADNHYVRLSKAPNAPVFAELLLEGGDGDTAAAGETMNMITEFDKTCTSFLISNVHSLHA